MASATLIATVRRLLQAHPPFAQMAPADLDFLAQRLTLVYFADGEILLSPAAGTPEACWIVRQGTVEGLALAGTVAPDESTPRSSGSDARPSAVVHLAPGEIFPVGALLAERAVTNTYRAVGDTFCWRLSLDDFRALTHRSPVFLDFCRRRMAALLDLSRQALQASQAAQATQWRAMSQPLADLLRGPAVTCRPDESLRAVFEAMEAQGVGSVVVTQTVTTGRPPVAGILTRQDVIGRVVLPGLSLDTPVSAVMTTPVLCARAEDTGADAMLQMAQRSVRHLPVTRDGELIGVVSERDLFVLQRRSLRQIGDSIRRARDPASLGLVAADIREWSHNLVAQGVAPGFITRLISRLNDQLTARLLETIAEARGIDLRDLCWLALGSEGREEQTIATDQDNGLIIGPRCRTPMADLLAFADAVNHALDACGYPLCRGGIMAGNPAWCLRAPQWADLFEHWIERGDPGSLLNASIFFDFRALAGDATLAADLSTQVLARARANPRFLKQMSDNALQNRPLALWSGNPLAQLLGREPAAFDLKRHGTMIFVDAARVLALANGIGQTGTAERLDALAAAGVLPATEVRNWIDAFQFLQALRLRAQERRSADLTQANVIDPRELSELDRRILKEAVRQARKLQDRLAMDYPG
jgi:CBS domain-containing protein